MVKKLKGKGILAFACTLAVLICMLCISVSADESVNVAKIGETCYATLQAAVTTAQNETTPITIEVLDNITLTEGLDIKYKNIILKSADSSDVKTITVQGADKTTKTTDNSVNYIKLNECKLTLENIKLTRTNASDLPDYALIKMTSNTTLTIEDGTIIENVYGGNGGAVIMEGENVNLIMNGGEIKNCKGEYLGDAIVNISASGTVTVNGGTISCSSDNAKKKPAVMIRNGNASFNGGKINGRISSSDNVVQAKAIYIEGSATVKISDKVISEERGDLIAISTLKDNSGTVYTPKNVTIVADESFKKAMTLVPSASPVKVNVELTKDEEVDLSAAECKNSTYENRWKISGKKCTVDGKNHTITVKAMEKSTDTTNSTGIIHFHNASDVTLKNITFTRDKKADYALFVIIDATLTLDGGAVIKDVSGGNGGAIYGTYSTAKLMMNDGAKIENCSSEWRSSAVEMEEGDFTMNGGTITGCSIPGGYGAVQVQAGTLTLNGGTIQNNTGGPAVLVSGTAKATVSDELVMSSNTGNIKAAAETSEVTINVEKSLQTAIDLIAENSAATTKIILTKDEVIDAATQPNTDKADTNWKITNKKILIDGQNHTVTVKAAGATHYTDGVKDIERGNMGSIRITNSNVTLKNVTFVRDGEADYGVFVLSTNAVLTLGDGFVIKNVKGSHGSAVWSQSNGHLIIDGGTIENCGKEGDYRGAVSFLSNNAKLTMNSGSIKNDSTKTNATAIWFDKGSTVDIKGGSFEFTDTTVPLIVMSDQGELTDGKLLGTLTIADGVSFGSSSTCVEIDRTKQNNGDATFGGSISVPTALKDKVAVKVGSGSSLTVTSKTSIVTNEEDGDTFAFVSDGKLYWISPSDFEIQTDFGKYTEAGDASAAATSTEVHVLRTLTTKSTAGALPVTLFGTVFVNSNGTITTLPTSDAWKNEESATFDEGKGFIVDMVDEKDKTNTSGTVYAVSFFKVNGIDDIVTTATEKIDYNFAGEDVKEISASQVAKNN